jgi:lipopolysaccharide transport system ATP-binding protein
MAAASIDVHGIGKRLRLGEDPQAYIRLSETLQSAIVRGARRLAGRGHTAERTDEKDFWALKDISFSVEPGELVALIGHNGAGKTTLLRVLSRISPPTTGWARLRGRVGSLLDVGTGFHPELTGRENTYLYGAVLGMRRAEVRARFDQIVEFAEVERFIDTPLKRYSSGMYLRLGFAVAAYLEPEILFVDEVLAVGDLAFQRRCVERMAEIARGGATLIFVSHNVSLVSSVCTRALLLERGGLVDDGPTLTVLDRYVESVQRSTETALEGRVDRMGNGEFTFVGIDVLGARGQPMVGDEMDVRIRYRSRRELDGLVVTASVSGSVGEPLFLLSNKLSGDDLDRLPPEGELRCTVPTLPLAPGRYSVTLRAEVHGELADLLPQASFFDVLLGDFYGERQNLLDRSPLFFVGHRWEARTLDKLLDAAQEPA